ncbi:DUF397 domain-containing protein [Streptomyces sp. NPDC018693]|uniref:DUF397 domain-containing protein n=1 Tax=unclassified Streptomyces TaxID=2593676 RepID=UPI003793607C
MSAKAAPPDASGLAWFKSSRSAGNGGECVEVAVRPDAIHIRDSKDTNRPALTVRPSTWTAFIGSTEL